MQRKRQLITPAQCICLLASIGLHALLWNSRAWIPVTTPARIELQQGRSAVELTLLPSVATVAKQAEPPTPPPVEEPPPVPVTEEDAAELSRPEPVEEPPPVEEPEPKQEAETIEQAADLKPKGTDAPAQSARSIKPVYPRYAQQNNQQGLVVVTATVSEEGIPRDVRVKQSSGFPLLDRAALKAVRKSRFQPALRNGRPIESLWERSFEFQLTNE